MRTMEEELSGYLDVKVPARVRKRGLTPWKAWNRQWCTVRRCEDSLVRIQLGSNVSNCVDIPVESTLCRSNSRSRHFAFGVFQQADHSRRPSLFLAGVSETETHKWMVYIRNLLRPHPHFDLNVQNGSRDFNVCLIDNAHSQAAGLMGFYGVLTVSPQHITLSGPSLEEVTVSWSWNQFHQFHLAVTGKVEDENRVCVLHTSSEFCAGPGQLYMFCMQAGKLLQCLLRRGGGGGGGGGGVRRQAAAPSQTPSPLRPGRRLSRSESDLRCYCMGDADADVGAGCHSPSHFLRRPVLMRSHSGSRDSGVRVSTASDDSAHALRGKVATSLISAGLGLLLSTPGCSEADTESLHEYQHIGSYDSDDDDEQVGALLRTNSTSTSTYSPRRESGISLASGIYEEILEDDVPAAPAATALNHYENPTALGWGRAYEETCSPPPLPPRKHKGCIQAKASLSEEALDERTKGGYTALALRQGHFQCYSASCSSLASPPPPSGGTEWAPRRRLLTQTEPDYMPMSPGGGSGKATPTPVPLEEQHYMVMASLNTS